MRAAMLVPPDVLPASIFFSTKEKGTESPQIQNTQYHTTSTLTDDHGIRNHGSSE